MVLAAAQVGASSVALVRLAEADHLRVGDCQQFLFVGQPCGG